MEEELISEILGQKIAELQRADALERDRRLRAEVGAPPEEFAPWPYRAGHPSSTARVPSETTLLGPSGSAGRFTPGFGMDSALLFKYDQPGPLSDQGALKSVTLDEVEAAAGRIEGERAAHQQRQGAFALQQQQEMAEYQRRLEAARAQEAARQMALEQTFGAQQERAEDIISLEALRGAEGLAPQLSPIRQSPVDFSRLPTEAGHSLGDVVTGRMRQPPAYLRRR